jgi:hypothetical protein
MDENNYRIFLLRYPKFQIRLEDLALCHSLLGGTSFKRLSKIAEILLNSRELT